jgi:hypothetical protein
MSKLRDRRQTIMPAQRGQIVQRVLVDGWSAAKAAAAFEVEERWVAAWVADYRRHGMASLRRDETASERLYRRLFQRVRSSVSHAFGGWWGTPARAEPAPCVMLRGSGDEGRLRR